MLSPEEKDEERRATGRRVRGARERARLSVSELAERAGLPRQYIYDLEGGIRVSVTNVASVSRALHVSTDYLLMGHEDKPLHQCCHVAADRDAWVRFHTDTDGLIRMGNGRYWVPTKQVLQGSVMSTVTGKPIRMISCSVYEYDGEVYRVGEPSQPAQE